MSGFRELEYKYAADHVDFRPFDIIMNKLDLTSYLEASSWDTYYTNPEHPNEFHRLRADPVKPELTRKVKTVADNNYDRVEVDLFLDPAKYRRAHVEEYLRLSGYVENFRIWKTCFIYFTRTVDYVYYIVYDDNMRELNRFVEVEVRKGKVAGLNSRGIDTTILLKSSAACLKELKIDVEEPIKQSLFELYRKS